MEEAQLKDKKSKLDHFNEDVEESKKPRLESGEVCLRSDLLFSSRVVDNPFFFNIIRGILERKKSMTTLSASHLKLSRTIVVMTHAHGSLT